MITHSAQGPELRLGRSCSPGKIAERRALFRQSPGRVPNAPDIAAPPELQHRNHAVRRPSSSGSFQTATVHPWVITTAKEAGAPAGFVRQIGEQRARGDLRGPMWRPPSRAVASTIFPTRCAAVARCEQASRNNRTDVPRVFPAPSQWLPTGGF